MPRSVRPSRVVSFSLRRVGKVDPDQRQHPVVEAVRRARDELEDLQVLQLDVVDARQHRVPHRGRQRPVRLPDHLGDEERVAARQLVHPRRVQGGAGHGYADRGLAQRPERECLEPVQEREVAQS